MPPSGVGGTVQSSVYDVGVHRHELEGSAFAKWDRRTTLVEKTGYLRRWEAKDESARARATLREDDGLSLARRGEQPPAARFSLIAALVAR